MKGANMEENEKENKPDFVYQCGTFRIELNTKLISKKHLQKILRNLPKG